MTNEKLYKKTDSMKYVSRDYKKSRLRWLGYVPIRMSNERILKVAIGCMDSNWEKEIKRGPAKNNLAENSNERAERR